jgi:hypothetical protein
MPKRKVTPKAAAKLIDGSKKQLNKMFDEGSGWAEQLAAALNIKGWKEARTYSACRKASFERTLQKEGRQVHITSSCFMGVFTDVNLSVPG